MPEILWHPSDERVSKTEMTRFKIHCEKTFKQKFINYAEFHRWSCDANEQFWSELFPYFGIRYEGELLPTCTDQGFKSYGWFPKIKLNFAENLLEHGVDADEALVSVHESGRRRVLSYKELRESVAQLAHSLRPLLSEGDVLAAYMPHIPETVISMLASSSIGALFTSTSADFGVEGVLDRFSQSLPKVLVTCAGYEYGGKYFDLRARLLEIEKRLPSLQKIIVVDFLGKGFDKSEFKKVQFWDDFKTKESVPLVFNRKSFEHPLYIMYSSGTTGKPKCIVHGQGGVLLQHVKELGLHTDLTKEKTIFYFTTCGWMMWNWLVSSLYFGSRVVLYEGSPGFPSPKEFFQIIDREKINIFGTSPKFLKTLEDAGWNKDSELHSLETILSTGSPLLPEQFDYVYSKIKRDICLSSISGGTDIIGCFMLGNPTLDVPRGEIQCLGLGMDVAAYDDQGNPIINKEGELVCRKSFPSRPIYFLGDESGEKIRDAYFNRFENTWHHGDFVQVTDRGTVIVYGRSDATLNPGGVRIGTAEIYRQTEQLDYIADSLCVGKDCEGDVDVWLFVKLKPSESLTDERINEIKKLIRTNTTPRHVPKHIFSVTDIPYTRSGKKMELAVQRIINGRALTNIEAVANPECLDEFAKF
ncbi:MAG: acetoacetate--CoA ligase [Bdellovibrio sp.]